MVDYVATITHLHLANMGLEGDLAPLRFCANVRVVYVYDNRLTSLGGLDGKLQMLTHLYAQNNLVESLDDGSRAKVVQQLYLNGNAAPIITGLQEALWSPSSALPRRRSSRSRPTTTIRTGTCRRGGRRCARALLFEPMSLLRVARTLDRARRERLRPRRRRLRALRPLGGLERRDARNNLLRSPMRVAMMLAGFRTR